jgi:hypothetical protein
MAIMVIHANGDTTYMGTAMLNVKLLSRLSEP